MDYYYRLTDRVEHAMDSGATNEVLSTIPYGLYGLTIHWNGEDHGMLASWVMQASFVPPMIAVAVRNESRSLPMIRESRSFGFNVLGVKQRKLAEKLSRTSFRTPQKLKGVTIHPGPKYRVPILTEGMAWLECRLVGTLPAGDHTLVLGEIVASDAEQIQELLTPAAADMRYEQ